MIMTSRSTQFSLQVRAFLYLGSGFVLLSLMSMVWRASQAIEHTWPWWVFGTALGIGGMTLFVLLERKRPELTAWIEKVQSWD